MKTILSGLAFAGLWASASVATKFGLMSAQPLLIANMRFFVAGAVMFIIALLLKNDLLPDRKEWKPLIIYGILNVTIYLGCFILAMTQLSAGIGSLAPALSPIFIGLMSAVWLKRKVRGGEIAALCLGVAGVALATYPLLQHSYASLQGLLIMGISMISYSLGTVYFAQVPWKLSRLAINAWQVVFGGLFLLPFTFLTYNPVRNHFDLRFWFSLSWLVIPVSIGAVQLWLYLVSQDAVKASVWLFLCPIFGFAFASLILHEPLSMYTFAGTALVITALLLAQKKLVPTFVSE